jgi:predicted metal-dependent phosphotriesterase family hydrolase
MSVIHSATSNVRNTVPHLRQMGVTDEQIRTITVMNPKAFFARG